MRLLCAWTQKHEKANYSFFQVPISPWSTDEKMKELGLYFYTAWTSDMEGVCQYMFGNVMGWEKKDISSYVAHLKAELKDLNHHGYIHYRVVYAQKPLDG